MTTTGPAEFFFRGNAVAAGGFLTRLGDKKLTLDPLTVTTHGESCLPWIGGISHSIVENPQLKVPQFISYGRCESYAEGRHEGDQTKTILRANVRDIRLTTSPSPGDNVPDVKSMSFHADSISVELQSTYSETGLPYFKIKATQPTGMALKVIDKSDRVKPLPVTLEFDEDLLKLSTMKAVEDSFLGVREFFEEYTERFPSRHKLTFGTSQIPRTPQGYVVLSFVRRIRVEGSPPINGNVLTRKGFGTIQFGLVLADTYNRRVTMARIKMGSDPGADVGFGGAETNGIWK